MNIKLNILKSLLDVISTISDLEYLESIWIKGLGPECSSFEETMCIFFDDFNAEEILINKKIMGLIHYLFLKKNRCLHE